MKKSNKIIFSDNAVVDKYSNIFDECTRLKYEAMGITRDDHVDALAYAVNYMADVYSIGGIKKRFKELGIKRYKIIQYDHMNITFKIPSKYIEYVKKLTKIAFMKGVQYNIEKLWFWQCWFEKIQII